MANTRDREVTKEVDIYQYPTSIDKRNPDERTDLALGDLHANYIKLLYFLITAGVVSLPADKYSELVEIYKSQFKMNEDIDGKLRFDRHIKDLETRLDREKTKAITPTYTLEAQQKEIERIRGWIEDEKKRVTDAGFDHQKSLAAYYAELDALKTSAESILSSVGVIDKNARVVLIGDELADRGASDYETLFLLNRIRSQGANVTSIVSNHGMDFLNLHEREAGYSKPSLGIGQAGSVVMIQHYLSGGLISKDQLNILTDNYKQTLDLLTYTLSPDKKNITLYTHAAIDLTVLKHIAKHFGIAFRAETSTELAETIDLINFSFKKDLAKGKAHDLFPTPEEAANILREFDGGEDLGGDDPEKRMNKQRMERIPLYTLIWNRTYDALERAKQPDTFTVTYVHGHDDGRESTVELDNVTNLDNHLGKYGHGQHNNIGSLNYSAASAVRKEQLLNLNKEDILDQTQRVLLDDLMRKVRALPQAYRDVKGNRTKRNDEMVDILVRQAEVIHSRNNLTDAEKRKQLVQLIFSRYRSERLHYSDGNRAKQLEYVNYINEKPHKERFARMLGLILQSEMQNDERLYLTAGIDQLTLPTVSAISPADKSSGQTESDNLKAIITPANDPAYTAITASELTNNLIINYRTVTPDNGQASSTPAMQSQRAQQQQVNFNRLTQEKITVLNGALKQIKQMLGVSSYPELPETLINRYWDGLSATGITGVEQMRELLSGESGNAVETAKQLANIIAKRLKAGSARHRDVQDFYLNTLGGLETLIKANSSEEINAAKNAFNEVAIKFFDDVKLGKRFNNIGSADDLINSASEPENTWKKGQRWQESAPSESSVIHEADEAPPPRNTQIIQVSEAQQRLDELNGTENLSPEQQAEKEQAEIKVKEEILELFLEQVAQVIGAKPLVDTSTNNQDYLENGAKMFWDQKAWGTVKGIENMRAIFQKKHGTVMQLADEIEQAVQNRISRGPGLFSRRHNDVTRLYESISETINSIKITQSVADAKISLSLGENTIKSQLEAIRNNYDAYLQEKKSVGDFLGFDDDDSLKPRGPGK